MRPIIATAPPTTLGNRELHGVTMNGPRRPSTGGSDDTVAASGILAPELRYFVTTETPQWG